MILFTCYVELTVKRQRVTILHQQNVLPHHLWLKLFSLVSSAIYSW